MKLQDRAALVAGGGQGIGEGIVRCMAEEGANIAIADINGENAAKLADELKAMGRKALALTADLTDDQEANRVIKETVDFFGKIDILVNVVGGSSRATGEIVARARAEADDENRPDYMNYTPEAWDNQYKLNLKSHVMLSQAVTPYFIKQKSGKIVNISSDAARLAAPDIMPYGAMKAADVSLTWSLARALAPHNINVNCICPGFVYTPLWDKGATARLERARSLKAEGKKLPPYLSADDIDNLSPYEFWLKFIVRANTPMAREQTPEDMGRAAVFLVSEDAKNITGQVLHVNGGMVMR